MKNTAKSSFYLFLLPAVALGLGIAWIDSRPGWDDAGITAAMIFTVAAVTGFLVARMPWLFALAVGIWVPLFSILFSMNFGGLLALVPGFAGAYAGYFTKKLSS